MSRITLRRFWGHPLASRQTGRDARKAPDTAASERDEGRGPEEGNQAVKHGPSHHAGFPTIRGRARPPAVIILVKDQI
jgi:hypothetical protein